MDTPTIWRDKTQPPQTEFIWYRLNSDGEFVGWFKYNNEKWSLMGDEEISQVIDIGNAGGIGGSSSIGKCTETSYNDLKVLKDEGKLVPGAFYRITDYQYDTVEPDVFSAGHRFDIIVQAISENAFSEDARAIQHEFTLEELPQSVYFTNGDIVFSLDGKETINSISYLVYKHENKKVYINLQNPTFSNFYDENFDGVMEYKYGFIPDYCDYDNGEGIITGEGEIIFKEDFREFSYFSNSDLSSWRLKYCFEPTIERFGDAVGRLTEGSFYVSSAYLSISPTIRYQYGTTLLEALVSQFSSTGSATVTTMGDCVADVQILGYNNFGWEEDVELYVITQNTTAKYKIAAIWVLKEEADNDNITKMIIAGRTTNQVSQRSYYSVTSDDTSKFRWTKAEKLIGGKFGVIYEMIDEFGNNVDYDFKNKLVQFAGAVHCSTNDESDGYYLDMQYPVYTFNLETHDDVNDTYSCKDVSLLGNAQNNYIRTLKERSTSYSGSYYKAISFFSSFSASCKFIDNHLDRPRAAILYCDYARNVIAMFRSGISSNQENTESAEVKNVLMGPDTLLYFGRNCFVEELTIISGGSVLFENATGWDSETNVGIYEYMGVSSTVVAKQSVVNPTSYTSYIPIVDDDEVGRFPEMTWFSLSGLPRDISSSVNQYISNSALWSIQEGLGKVRINSSWWYGTTVNGIKGFRYHDYFFYYDSDNDKYYLDEIANLTQNS